MQHQFALKGFELDPQQGVLLPSLQEGELATVRHLLEKGGQLLLGLGGVAAGQEEDDVDRFLVEPGNPLLLLQLLEGPLEAVAPVDDCGVHLH